MVYAGLYYRHSDPDVCHRLFPDEKAMTPEELRTLIADIEALGDKPHTRQLSDRVLLACGWEARPWTSRFEAGRWHWKGSRTTADPDPLSSIDDAVLMVPEWMTYELHSEPAVCTPRYSFVKWRNARKTNQDWQFAGGGNLNEPQALTLAALKARLAQMESEDG